MVKLEMAKDMVEKVENPDKTTLKNVNPYRIRNAKAFPRKETWERKSYAIDWPFRSEFESIGLSLFLTFLGGPNREWNGWKGY